MIVAAIGIGVWWVPGFSAFVLLPPLLLGVGVGIVARYSGARPLVLVVTAAATTAILFSTVVVRYSSYGVHGDAMRTVVAVGSLVVVEAALAAAAGATFGRRQRDRETAAARSA
jgi:hypothetical protein